MDNQVLSERDKRAIKYFCIMLMVAGFYFFLHGTLSLLGLFGFERHMMALNGEPIPTENQMTREALSGIAVLIASTALYIKVFGARALLGKI
ncbi:MAG TPA: hypothetical protein VEK08_07810 [Planctomycetota bacterium]|nr:hypothetical protein [Planctomycetota bacterium]